LIKIGFVEEIEMIETEDETKQKRPTTTKKRTIDVLESTVRDCEENLSKKKIFLFKRQLNNKNVVDHQDIQHLVHQISILLKVKANQVIKQPEKMMISNQNS